MPTASPPTLTAQDERPWRTEGLFSPHYLIHRLPGPKSAAWPDTAEAGAVFEAAAARFAQYQTALLSASEEDCESKWILPLTESLGFGRNARKAIPSIPASTSTRYSFAQRIKSDNGGTA